VPEPFRFRFSRARRPEGRPLSAQEAERILRARVGQFPGGSPEHHEARWELARFLGMTGRHADGLAELETLLAASPDPEECAEIVLAMGQFLEGLGDFAGAIETYSRGVALEPIAGRTWYLLHNNLGYSLNQLGRFVEGERWCRAAIAIDPARHNAWKNVGLACRGQGRHAEAAACLIEAVRRDASDPRALLHLEELLEERPELLAEDAALAERLARCRAAVAAAHGREP
jgi:Flp pilus assembly protein TadD